MRISNNMSVSNHLRNLNKTSLRQYQLQQQLADGKTLHRPSDDPIKTVRSLTFHTGLNTNTKLTESNRDALSWMNNSDTAMNDMSAIMIRVKELVVQAGNPNPDMAMSAIGNQIDTLINELVTLGNSKVGDRYLFAGQSDHIQPFRREIVNGQDTVVYYGDLNKIAMRLQTGTIDPTQDSVGLNGAELFGPLTMVEVEGSVPPEYKAACDVFTNLIRIKDVLQGMPSSSSTAVSSNAAVTAESTVIGYPSTGVTTEYEVRIDNVTAGNVTSVSYRKKGDADWISGITPDADGQFVLPDGVGVQIGDDAANAVNDIITVTAYPGSGIKMVDGNSVGFVNYEGLANVDAAHDALLKSVTRLGARMSFYEMMENVFADNDLQLSDDISKNEDLDWARALIDFQTNENLYRTSLAIGARIIPPSLVDFLS